MRTFAFVCLFAAAYAAPEAEAEADPALLYSTLGYGYHGYPYTYGYHHAAVPAVYTAAVKNVEVKPAEVKTTVHSPVVYNTAALPVAHAASYYANSGGAVHIVKR